MQEGNMLNKKKKIICVLAVILIPAVLGVYAFLSATDEGRANRFLPAPSLDTVINESFRPITVSLDNVSNSTVNKTVKLKNNGSVPCYMRASVEFSSSDFNASLQNSNRQGNLVTGDGSKWMLGDDGYYYYKDIVVPGGTTDILFDKVVFGNVDKKYLKHVEDFTIYVSQESISAFHGGAEFNDYESAWNFHMGER